MTREATAARSDGAVVGWRDERDDGELRRSLDAFLRDSASADASDGLTATPGVEPAAGDAGAPGVEPAAGDAGAPARSTASAPRRSRGISAAGLALILLGGLLVIAGAALMAPTITGSRVIDQARLAELWPPVLVLVGLVTIAEAFVVRPATARAARPSAADGGGDAPSAGRDTPGRSGQSVAPVPVTPVTAPAERGGVRAAMAAPATHARAAADLADLPETDVPVSRPAVSLHVDAGTNDGRVMADGEALATGADARPAPDAVAVLLELRALRRDRLISRKQYRAKRRAVVAGIAPRFVGSTWPDGGSVGHPRDAAAAGPLAYWGPTAE